MTKSEIGRPCVAWILLSLLAPLAIAQQPMVFDFNADKIGAEPRGFTAALTGRGKPGKWLIAKDYDSPERGNILAQTEADPTDYRFPVCVYHGLSLKDADISVNFKTVSGKGDQAAGIVWRYKDKDNYYVLRANALEGNVVLYKVQDGKRTDLPLKGQGRTYGVKVAVPSGKWLALRVVAKGSLFTVYFEGKQLFQVEDSSLTASGKFGFWTKADSVTYFDDLKVSVL